MQAHPNRRARNIQGSEMKKTTKAFAALIAALAITGHAYAQKSKDALRIAFKDPISTTDIYIDPKPETSLTAEAIFDKLLTYLPSENAFKPMLATSWKQVSPVVLELQLRKGVKFHDGKPFTADDVVYTFNYIIDPKSKLRFGRNWGWIKSVEKTGDFSVRITSKRPTPFALARLATSTPIYPKHVHSKFEKRGEFGRKAPIGTGPYKAEFVDPSRGIKLVRYDGYVSPGPWSPKASIKTILIQPMPELQTQIAQLMTGGLDVILEAPKDQSEQLAQSPTVKSTAIKNTVYYYANFDAAGRSDQKALANRDVRRAIVMAINRQALADAVIAGGKLVELLDTPCTPSQVACKATVSPAKFDPKEAKALLAKAGYPNGFDLDITSIPGAHELAEAIAGQLRVIGIKAKVSRLTIGAYRKKQVAGKLQMLVSHYSSGGLPDASSVMAFYQAGPRDYWRDKQMQKFRNEGAGEMDEKKREAIYIKAFNHINEQALALPIATHPAVLIHSADVTLPSISSLFAGVEFNNIKWK
jgi:peptide/nickel transport system substrate-binding protein